MITSSILSLFFCTIVFHFSTSSSLRHVVERYGDWNWPFWRCCPNCHRWQTTPTLLLTRNHQPTSTKEKPLLILEFLLHTCWNSMQLIKVKIGEMLKLVKFFDSSAVVSFVLSVRRLKNTSWRRTKLPVAERNSFYCSPERFLKKRFKQRLSNSVTFLTVLVRFCSDFPQKIICKQSIALNWPC